MTLRRESVKIRNTAAISSGQRARRAPVQRHLSSPMNEGPSATADVLPQPKRILCADDNRLVRETIRLVLERASYVVKCAADGREACQIIMDATEPFDLLVTDHDMPHVCGLELVRQLKANRRLPAVVVISGSLTPENIRQYKELGVERVLTKPFLTPTILEAVRTGCDRTERKIA